MVMRKMLIIISTVKSREHQWLEVGMHAMWGYQLVYVTYQINKVVVRLNFKLQEAPCINNYTLAAEQQLSTSTIYHCRSYAMIFHKNKTKKLIMFKMPLDRVVWVLTTILFLTESQRPPKKGMAFTEEMDATGKACFLIWPWPLP